MRGLEIKLLGHYGSLGSRLEAELDRTKSHTYPRGFWVPDLAKFMGDDAKTTYEHIG
jgi:hypothetical protein